MGLFTAGDVYDRTRTEAVPQNSLLNAQNSLLNASFCSEAAPGAQEACIPCSQPKVLQPVPAPHAQHLQSCVRLTVREIARVRQRCDRANTPWGRCARRG